MASAPRSDETGWPGIRKVAPASVTPLASIFGSGFLIIVPILERTLGRLAVFGAIAVCGLAWLIGIAVRHVVRVVEPMLDDGSLDQTTRRLDRLGDWVIVVAYVISVALYVRIMAQYVVTYAGSDSALAERALASAAIATIVGIGVFRGYGGLDWLERMALGAVLVLVTILGGAFAVSDAGQVLGQGLTLPPIPDTGFVNVVLVLGGIVIAVQGFETVRYLQEEFDRPTRIWASRLSQAVAASIYIGFVAVATPLMGLGSNAGADGELTDITTRIAPLLTLPVVVCAVLSQFSAATADTVAAGGNLHKIGPSAVGGSRAYVVSGIAAIALALTVPTLTVVAIASRAFAAYYAIQSAMAFRTCEGAARKIFYAMLALVLVAITLLAKPAN